MRFTRLGYLLLDARATLTDLSHETGISIQRLSHLKCNHSRPTVDEAATIAHTLRHWLSDPALRIDEVFPPNAEMTDWRPAIAALRAARDGSAVLRADPHPYTPVVEEPAHALDITA